MPAASAGRSAGAAQAPAPLRKSAFWLSTSDKGGLDLDYSPEAESGKRFSPGARAARQAGPTSGISSGATLCCPEVMLRIFEPKDPDYSARLRSLGDRSAETPPAIEAAARDVIHQVRRRGDAAVRELTEKFEKRGVDALELPRAKWTE